MRRLLTLAFLATIALGPTLLAGCGGDDEGENGGAGRLRVVATIAPTGALAQQVGRDLIDLVILAKAGLDPHEYELRTDDRKAVERAAVIVRNGLGVDSFLDGALEGRGDKVTTVTDGMTLRDAEEEGAGNDDHGHDEHEHDAHVWQDPENDKYMVDAIVAAFAKADAANAATYHQNGDAYKATLDETDRQIRALIDSIPQANRKMVTNHDAFGYFIARYGLTFVGAIIPGLTTQAEPSAKQLAELVDTIRREGVKAIFSEGSVDPKIAQQIGRDTGAKVVDDLYGDTLGEPGSGADTIHGMLLANAQKIAEALK